MDSKSVMEIQSEVLAYLKEHPEAKDTAEGIRQWWLFHRMAKYSQEKVELALQQLAEGQQIEVHKLGDGMEVFGVIRTDFNEIN